MAQSLFIGEQAVKINISNWLWNFILISFGWLCLHTNANALPFGVYDARTMAMGGVGVATGARNAAFNNPALLTTADEVHEWFLLLPTTGQQLDDGEDLKDNLADFKQAANTLDATPGPANEAAVQASLNAIDGSQYRQTKNLAFMLAIPSRILSGAVFLNSYEISNVQPIIGGDNLLVPTYASTLAHRGVRIVENGVSAAKTLNSKSEWLNNLSIGFSIKFLLIETYAYTESIRVANVDIVTSQGNNGAQFAIDAGLFKEFGVWKVGLVAKNLLPGNYDYGVTNEKFRIEPQLRAGFAYKSRRTIVEFNIDLTKNDPVGFDTASQIAAVGWQWHPWRSFSVRAGYNKNLIEADTESTSSGAVSAGLGLLYSGFHFDVSGYTGDEGDGLSAQLGLQF
jgi:hypothetical protein